MTQRAIPLTAQGRCQLEEELEQLVKVRRPKVAEDLKEAKDVGGGRSNAALQAAKDEQGFIEGRIRHLEHILRYATLIATDAAPSQWIKLGSRVTLVHPDGSRVQYTIVGSTEADPRKGLISNESPVGRTLLGHRVGEPVDVLAPRGVSRYTVVAIE